MAWRPVCECGWRGDPGTRDVADGLAWQHEVWHWTEESCRASGVPFHVQDPIALRDIAALLGRPRRKTGGLLGGGVSEASDSPSTRPAGIGVSAGPTEPEHAGCRRPPALPL